MIHKVSCWGNMPREHHLLWTFTPANIPLCSKRQSFTFILTQFHFSTMSREGQMQTVTFFSLIYVNFTLQFHLPFASVWSHTVAPPCKGKWIKLSWWFVIQNLFFTIGEDTLREICLTFGQESRTGIIRSISFFSLAALFSSSIKDKPTRSNSRNSVEIRLT